MENAVQAKSVEIIEEQMYPAHLHMVLSASENKYGYRYSWARGAMMLIWSGGTKVRYRIPSKGSWTKTRPQIR